MTTLTIAKLTIRETQRRRILWISMLMGLTFVACFAIGFHYVFVELEENLRDEDIRLAASFLTTAGLYATNFLIIVMSVLTSVTTISSEVETHTVEAILTKPVRRWEVVLGKWVGYAFMLMVYIAILVGGILLTVYLRAGLTVSNIGFGISLMILQGLIVLSLSIAGGTRLSTLSNGVLAFAFYGIAFLGSFIEQIGAFLRNETAVNIGIITSLLMPSEILRIKAFALFFPQFANNAAFSGPFTVASQPSDTMLWYSVGYALMLLLFALWSFANRDL